MKTLLEFIIEAEKEPSYKKDPTKYIYRQLIWNI